MSAASVIAAIEDSSEELDAYFPVALQLACQRLQKSLDSNLFSALTTVGLTVGGYQATPADAYGIIQSITYRTSAGLYGNLQPVSYEFIKDYWPNPTVTGTPRVFARGPNNRIQIAPSANDTTYLAMSYEDTLVPTSVTASSNGLGFIRMLAYMLQPLYCATMVECYRFLKSDERANAWETRLQDALAVESNFARRTRNSNERAQSNPNNPLNRIKPGIDE
jgi:hypothetical protein